jgi:hypothetical protein
MLTYSPRKNMANFSEEYSVWKPPVSSPSPSARSNGRRLVSPTMVTTYTAKLTHAGMMCQRSFWASTICDVDIEPL